MCNCTCHAFNYVVIQDLSERHDSNLLTDNPCVMELSRVVPVMKGVAAIGFPTELDDES